ncbi:TPA: hypothetical protein ACIJ25_006508 [Pseudomonas aeruginosa]
MKTIIKALILMAVFATANSAFAADVSMCKVSEEAMQGNVVDYDPDEIDVAVICNDDIQMKGLIAADPDAFNNEFTKWVLSAFGYTKDFVINTFSLSKIYDDSFLPIFLGLIIFYSIFHLANKGIGIARNQDKKESIEGFVTYAAVFLIAALSLLANHYVRAPQAVIATAYQNGVSNTALIYMAEDASTGMRDTDSAEMLEVVSMMNRTSHNILRNAFAEELTKYLCLQKNTVNLSRSDYLSLMDTSSTKREIFDNFEKNVRFELEAITENDVTKKFEANWYTDFDDYQEDKYCSKGLGYEIANDAFPSNFDQFDNDDVAELVIKKGVTDGESFMTSERTRQQLSKYENQAFSAIRGAGLKTILRLTDDMVNNASESVQSGLKEVEEILIREKVETSNYGYYQNAYANMFAAAAAGIQSTTAAANVKIDISRRHALYEKTWNCSNNFAMHKSTRFSIKKLNSYSDDTNFAQIAKDVAEIDWSCGTIKDGVAIFTGTDKKENIAEYSDKALAVAASFAMFDSRILEGVRRGQKNFKPSVDTLKNEILAIARLGRGGFGEASIPYRQIAAIRSRSTIAINNSYNVSLVGSVNKGNIDEMMLFGSEQDSKDLQDNPFYKNVISYAKNFHIEALIDDTKGAAGISYEVAAVKESSTGLFEIAKAFLENTFDYNEAMKENLGMDVNLTYEAGYNQCKLSPQMCERRYSGTLNDIVVSGGQDIFQASFKFYMLLEALETAKIIGDLGSLVDSGYAGDSTATKFLSKALSFLGKTAAVVIGLLYALLAGFKPIITFAMVIGIIAGWIIPMMEVIMTFLQSLNYIFGYWVASFIFAYKLVKATQSGRVDYILDAFKAYFAIFLVGLFTTTGMVFVQWATKSMTVGHEMRALLGITSDIFLVGSLVGTMAIHAVSLYFMYHIYSMPTKAGSIAENITGMNIGMTDVHSQNGRLEGFAQGVATRATAINPTDSLKGLAAEKVRKKQEENLRNLQESREAGKNQPPRETEGTK